jgi:hypothetical protein
MAVRYGSSIVNQFAGGHDFSAVLRELVQNEFDAGGRRLQVSFESTGLRVIGSGKSIDSKGWRRLSVMLGTGDVAGTNLHIEAKPNGIGSKNFGLRALFLVGDTIHLRSGGRTNTLDRSSGAYLDPDLDPETRGRPGVEIWVPYRSKAASGLPAFDRAREAAALGGLARGLAPTLAKLAVPGAARSLEAVLVRSERFDRTLEWRQHAERVKCGVRGVEARQRVVRLMDSDGEDVRTPETEFVRHVEVPARFRGQQMPGYFVRPKGRVAVGVSVRTERAKLDTGARGTWYYPIGVEGGATGTCVSVSAPFEMNNDRSAIVSTAVSDWNRWLVECAVDLALDLVTGDWWERFGADAYTALHPAGGASDPHFAEALGERLKAGKVWPTRAKDEGERFAVAGSLVIPDHPALDGFLAQSAYSPAEALRRPGFAAALRAAGARPFGVNSLVRLRCADKNPAGLATRLATGDADFHYTAYQAALGGVTLQVQFATALDAVERRLSRQNREDLKDTASTLSATGTLRPAKVLVRVPTELADACHIPAGDRLHPALVGSRVLRQAAQPFKPLGWAADAARRIAHGGSDDEEREALYSFLKARHGRLPVTLLATLRGAPVVKDHRGDWTAPRDLVKRTTPGARAFAPVLRFPHPDVADDPELARALRIRDRLCADDLVAFARRGEEDPNLVGAFERVVTTHQRLLTQAAVRKLHGIRCISSSEGSVAAPSTLYVDIPKVRGCLGDTGPYAAGGLGPKLYTRLGCRTEPLLQDVLGYIEGMASTQSAPGDPEPLYAGLLAALERDRGDHRSLRERPILWTDTGWARPLDVVLGAGLTRIPTGSVPRPASGAAGIITAYERLGASRMPLTRHWRRVLEWVGSNSGGKPLAPPLRAAVRAAYAQLAEDPGEFPRNSPVLLDRDGRLHAPALSATQRFVVDDYPELADAVRAARLPVVFADTSDPRTLRFYNGLGVPGLRSASKYVKFQASGGRHPPPRLKPDEILGRIHDPAFASALAALVAHRLQRRADVRPPRSADLARRLRGIEELGFVQELAEVYRVAGRRVAVPVGARLDGGRVLFAGIHGRSEALGALADIVAGWLPGADSTDWADPVFRLLAVEGIGEMRTFLRSRGVSWTPPGRRGTADADDADEVAEALAALGPLFENVRNQRADRQPDRKLERPDLRPRPPLPDLDLVRARVKEKSGLPLPSIREKGGHGGGSSWGGSDGARDEERDREIGRRGEQIVLGMERERLVLLGRKPEEAVWAADLDPNADHDIRSVTADGDPLWIEVKATSERGGRFRWSRAEFDLARRARDRYVLYRIYQAGSLEPIIKVFTDPVAMLLGDRIRLDIAMLQAEVEPA